MKEIDLAAGLFLPKLSWDSPGLRRTSTVIGLGLRQVQEALDRKADAIQREFITYSGRIDEIGRKLLELRGEEHQSVREEQKALRVEQQELADEINLWRERSRAVMRQGGKEGIRKYLNELLELDDDMMKPAIERALYFLDAPEEELAGLDEQLELVQLTAAGRLIERSRTDYDLRGSDPAIRQREAIVFANRPGMAQDDDALEEIEASMDDPDPIVRELAILTTIQLHRFRAMRMADLDTAHQSVQYLTRLNHRVVIPILIEVLENPRSGFITSEGKTIDSENGRSRMVALLRLVEWHTAEVKSVIMGRKFDRDQHIVRAAARALELFPGPWSSPLKGKGPIVNST